MNVLLITADQWRAECLSGLGHQVVRTPNLDSLAADGVMFTRHFAQATPCAPSRTSLHTGMYMFNHRCVSNGTPVSSHLSNWALEVQKAGYQPSLFGYTDTAADPSTMAPEDPRLTHYSEPLPGIGDYTPIKNDVSVPWVEYLTQKGHRIPQRWLDLYSEEKPGLPWREGGSAPLPLKLAKEDHETYFMTDKCMAWINAQEGPWITHLSLLRPHPPFVAPEPYNQMYSPDDLALPHRHQSTDDASTQHPFLRYALSLEKYSGNIGDRTLLETKASYFGLMTEVDDNLGRLFAFLKATDQWDNTLIIFTSDHGEQMGDQWLMSKLGFYDASYHIPLIVRDPRSNASSSRGKQITSFTENVDIMPTMLEWLGREVPSQCDGESLLPFLQEKVQPDNWRSDVHWEFDFRDVVQQQAETSLGLPSAKCHLAVIRSERYKYVHFAGLAPLLFDLEADPCELDDLASNVDYREILLEYAGKLLDRRMTYTARGLSDIKLTADGPITRANSAR